MQRADLESLREPILTVLRSASRANSYKRQRYWYPLSVASYDVEEILSALDCLCSFQTTMWEKTAQFEEAFARRIGSAQSIMVNSGSSADLLIAFAAVNRASGLLNPGDEVLIPAVTWPTQVWSVMMAGLRVRLVDADLTTFNVDINDLEAKISERTRAVFIVHLMGNPCDMERVTTLCRRHNLLLFEDCCEALGARFDGRVVGTFGEASSFSFFFSHHITTMEGGMICTDDAALADLLRLLRSHGWARNARTSPEAEASLDPRYLFLNWGFNVRPLEVQAAFGLVQLSRLPEFLRLRVQNADRFRSLVTPLQPFLRLMSVDARAECSWFALPFIVSEEASFSRTDVLQYLEAGGVETRPLVAGNLARQPAARLFPELSGQVLPASDLIHERAFYVGLHPSSSSENLERLADMLHAFVATRA